MGPQQCGWEVRPVHLLTAPCCLLPVRVLRTGPSSSAGNAHVPLHLVTEQQLARGPSLHHLLEGQCNPDLRLLGCAVLAPRCEGGRVRRPCRHVCGALREACQPAFDAIDMAWPYFLDCGRYFSGPEEGCYDPLEKLRGGFWGGPTVVSGWMTG